MLIVLPTIMFASALYIDISSNGGSSTAPIILVISLALFETALVLIFFQKTMTIFQDRIEFTYSVLVIKPLSKNLARFIDQCSSSPDTDSRSSLP